MPEADLLRRVAPCGLDCGRCLDNPESPIAFHARELRRELGGASRLAAFFAEGVDPVFAAYGDFERLLERLGRGGCRGCREGTCFFTACRVKNCVKEQGVDFCFECGRFDDCDPGLPPGLAERWRANNERMRNVGLTEYACWLDGQPRY